MINEKAVQYDPFERSFRIVGTIWDGQPKEGTEPFGYFLLDEQQIVIKPFSSTQVKALLNGFSFSNAKLENSKVVNTECSMFRLPKFNKQLKPIDANNLNIVQVLAEVSDPNDSSVTKYRVMGPVGSNTNVLILSEPELIKLKEAGKDIANAKIVDNGEHKIVSGIKSEFNVLSLKNKGESNPKSAKIDDSEHNKVIGASEWRKAKALEHVEKSMKSILLRILHVKVSNSKSYGTGRIYIPKKYGKFTEGADKKNYINLFNIIENEVLVPSRGYKLSKNEVEIFNKVKEDLKLGDDGNIGYTTRSKAICQLLLSNEAFRKYVLTNINTSKLSKRYLIILKNFIQDLKAQGLLSDNFKSIVTQSGLLQKVSEADKGYLRLTEKDIEFIDEKSINKIGFTLNKSNDNTYMHDNDYKIKYIGNYLSMLKYLRVTEQELLADAKHFGDASSILDIAILVDREYQYRKDGRKPMLPLEDALPVIEFIISAAYCNKSKNVINFIMRNKNELLEIGVNPGLFNIQSINDFVTNHKVTNTSAKYYFNSGFRAIPLTSEHTSYVKYDNVGRQSLNTPIDRRFIKWDSRSFISITNNLSIYFGLLKHIGITDVSKHEEACIQLRSFS